MDGSKPTQTYQTTTATMLHFLTTVAFTLAVFGFMMILFRQSLYALGHLAFSEPSQPMPTAPIPFVSDLPSSLLTIICGWQPTMVHHSVTPPIPAGIVLLAFGPALIGISLSCHCPGSF